MDSDGKRGCTRGRNLTRVPGVSYVEIVRALQRDSWTVVRQRGSPIRIQKRMGDDIMDTLKMSTIHIHAHPHADNANH